MGALALVQLHTPEEAGLNLSDVVCLTDSSHSTGVAALGRHWAQAWEKVVPNALCTLGWSLGLTQPETDHEPHQGHKERSSGSLPIYFAQEVKTL